MAIGRVETSILCLTDGQAAHFRGEASSAAELGKLRRAEFVAACEVLKVTQHEIFTFPTVNFSAGLLCTHGAIVEYIANGVRKSFTFGEMAESICIAITRWSLLQRQQPSTGARVLNSFPSKSNRASPRMAAEALLQQHAIHSPCATGRTGKLAGSSILTDARTGPLRKEIRSIEKHSTNWRMERVRNIAKKSVHRALLLRSTGHNLSERR